MSEIELEQIINRIKNRRLELDLSYQNLADLTGISKSTLQRYETGYIRKVPITQISVIAKALLVTPNYLMGWNQTDEIIFSNNEIAHIKKYRALDERGKQAVDDTLEREYEFVKPKAEESAIS